MSARDKDARAAMREIMRSWLAGEIDGPMEPGAVAHDAWGYADAMEVRADDAVLNIALASENAKLRAVAEAAARLQRLRDSNRPDGIGEASLQLDGALGNWLPGWRTK